MNALSIILLLLLIGVVAVAVVLYVKYTQAQGAKEQAEQQAAQDSNIIAELKEVLTKLNSENLATQSEVVSQRVHADVDKILTPVKEEVGNFRKRVEELREASIEQKSTLEEKFRQMHESTHQLSEDAQSLTDALRGSAQQRGAWGEVSLSRALEAVGLVEGNNGGFETQRTYRGTDNEQLRPDVVVHLPGDRHVVIDAKVSLVAYNNYVAEETEDQRATHLKEMERSLRTQVDQLTKYLEIPELNTAGIVLMFTPIEPAWQLAYAQFPQLFVDARKAGVIICGPTTLLATLRLIEQIWRAEKSAQNVSTIIASAKDLQDAVVRLVERIDKISGLQEKATNEFKDLIGKNIDGRQGVVAKWKKIEQLGAVAKKEMPKVHVEAALAENIDLEEIEEEKAA